MTPLILLVGLLEAGLQGVDPGSLVAQTATPGDPGAFSCYVDADRNLLNCVIGEYSSVTGDALFGLLVGGTMLGSLYVAADGDLVVPAVITTLFGGALVPMLPGQYQGIALVIMLLGLVGGVFAAGVKYVARGGM